MVSVAVPGQFPRPGILRASVMNFGAICLMILMMMDMMNYFSLAKPIFGSMRMMKMAHFQMIHLFQSHLAILGQLSQKT